jgi:CheY-like chemotaxis protein
MLMDELGKRTPANGQRNEGNRESVDLPPIGRIVAIIHNGHQSMAYRDSLGNWRNSHNGDILSGEVRILNPRAEIPKQAYKLLLVEDSDDDVVLFDLTLRRSRLHETFKIIHRLCTGDAAIEYFTHPPANGSPRPDIVILDIKLPRASGFEILQAISGVRPRPVIAVFTSSSLDEDKQQADTLGADVFQTKTFEPKEFSRFLQSLASLADKRVLP